MKSPSAAEAQLAGHGPVVQASAGPPAGTAQQPACAPLGAGSDAAAVLGALLEDGAASWKDVMWQACRVAAEQHPQEQCIADDAFGESRQLVYGRNTKTS